MIYLKDNFDTNMHITTLSLVFSHLSLPFSAGSQQNLSFYTNKRPSKKIEEARVEDLQLACVCVWQSPHCARTCNAACIVATIHVSGRGDNGNLGCLYQRLCVSRKSVLCSNLQEVCGN